MVITLAGKILIKIISDLKKTYLALNIIHPFLATTEINRDSEDFKKKTPIINDYESSRVANKKLQFTLLNVILRGVLNKSKQSRDSDQRGGRKMEVELRNYNRRNTRLC